MTLIQCLLCGRHCSKCFSTYLFNPEPKRYGLELSPPERGYLKQGSLSAEVVSREKLHQVIHKAGPQEGAELQMPGREGGSEARLKMGIAYMLYKEQTPSPLSRPVELGPLPILPQAEVECMMLKTGNQRGSRHIRKRV